MAPTFGLVYPRSLLSHKLCTARWLSSTYPKFHQIYRTSTEALPRVAQPSTWHSIIPKFIRERNASSTEAKTRRLQDWNPATFFIVIFLFIGSNAIQMITLKNEFSTFSRKADAKIALLKEVLDRIQRGEQVDVGKVLGTGDEQQEQEWKEVIQNIEDDDFLWQSKAEKREKKAAQRAEEAASMSSKKSVAVTHNYAAEEDAKSSQKPKKAPGFY